MVGDQHFVCRIESQHSMRAMVDWRRYDILHTPHCSMDAPDHIRFRIQKLMSELGINFGALDFIVTPSDEWVFLEVNPVGQWLWIEDLTGMKISDAIAQWLLSHHVFSEEVIK